MRKLLAGFVAITLVASTTLAGVAASAQQSVEGQTAYERLAHAYASDVHRDESFTAMFAVIQQYFRSEMFGQDEDLLALEAQCPGTIDAIFSAMQPVIRAWFLQEFLDYRMELAGLFSAELTPGDAEEAAEFFESELGRKLMHSVRQSISIENAIANGVFDDGDSLNEEGPEFGVMAPNIREIAATMIPEDRDRIYAVYRSSSWAASWEGLHRKLLDLRAEREISDIDEETLARAGLTIEEAILAHTASCPR